MFAPLRVPKATTKKVIEVGKKPKKGKRTKSKTRRVPSADGRKGQGSRSREAWREATSGRRHSVSSEPAPRDEKGGKSSPESTISHRVKDADMDELQRLMAETRAQLERDRQRPVLSPQEPEIENKPPDKISDKPSAETESKVEATKANSHGGSMPWDANRFAADDADEDVLLEELQRLEAATKELEVEESEGKEEIKMGATSAREKGFMEREKRLQDRELRLKSREEEISKRERELRERELGLQSESDRLEEEREALELEKQESQARLDAQAADITSQLNAQREEHESALREKMASFEEYRLKTLHSLRDSARRISASKAGKDILGVGEEKEGDDILREGGKSPKSSSDIFLREGEKSPKSSSTNFLREGEKSPKNSASDGDVLRGELEDLNRDIERGREIAERLTSELRRLRDARKAEEEKRDKAEKLRRVSEKEADVMRISASLAREELGRLVGERRSAERKLVQVREALDSARKELEYVETLLKQRATQALRELEEPPQTIPSSLERRRVVSDDISFVDVSADEDIDADTDEEITREETAAKRTAITFDDHHLLLPEDDVLEVHEDGDVLDHNQKTDQVDNSGKTEGQFFGEEGGEAMAGWSGSASEDEEDEDDEEALEEEDDGEFVALRKTPKRQNSMSPKSKASPSAIWRGLAAFGSALVRTRNRDGGGKSSFDTAEFGDSPAPKEGETPSERRERRAKTKGRLAASPFAERPWYDSWLQSWSNLDEWEELSGNVPSSCLLPAPPPPGTAIDGRPSYQIDPHLPPAASARGEEGTGSDPRMMLLPMSFNGPGSEGVLSDVKLGIAPPWTVGLQETPTSSHVPQPPKTSSSPLLPQPQTTSSSPLLPQPQTTSSSSSPPPPQHQKEPKKPDTTIKLTPQTTSTPPPEKIPSEQVPQQTHLPPHLRDINLETTTPPHQDSPVPTTPWIGPDPPQNHPDHVPTPAARPLRKKKSRMARPPSSPMTQ